MTVEPSAGFVDKVAWTADGQILTVSTVNGMIYNYLARLPRCARVNV